MRSSAAIVSGLVVIALAISVLMASLANRGTSPIEETAGAEAEHGPVPALADPDATYNPERAGEELPAGYRQLLYRDQIAPIYNPRFTTAAGVDWPGEMLVIGIAGKTEAKAYPVAPLNSREMVIDSLEGIPILVTW